MKSDRYPSRIKFADPDTKSLELIEACVVSMVQSTEKAHQSYYQVCKFFPFIFCLQPKIACKLHGQVRVTMSLFVVSC